MSNHHPTAQDMANLRVSLPPTATLGQPVSFTVQARTVSDTVATAYTGTVRFNSTDLAAGLPTEYTFTAGDNGVHTFTATFNAVGPQILAANDTYYSQMIRGSAVTQVGQGVAVGLTSGPNPSDVGQAVTFTATLTPVGPSGTVTFTGVPVVGGAAFNIGSAPVVTTSGQAVISTTNLPTGTFSVTASYGGDASYLPAVSSSITQVVRTACAPEVVTRATDNGNDVCGSLSYALKAAAVSPSPVYTISFQNVATVTLTGPLPVISSTNDTSRVVVEGGCKNGQPGVALQALPGSAPVEGLHLKSRVSLDGLKLVGFGGYAVTLEGDNNELSCNWLGTADGKTALPNGGGLRIGQSGVVTASNNRLGRPNDPTSGNLIAGNTGVGFLVEAGQGNLAYYNLIGLTSDGSAGLANRGGTVRVASGGGLKFLAGNRMRAA